MKISYDDDQNIRIRLAEGIILVLGGWDNSYSKLCDAVEKRAKYASLTLRYAALGISGELGKTEFSSIQERMQDRCRFIAPLVEGLFGTLKDKDYCLIVVHAASILDINDFKQELESKFTSILIIDHKDINKDDLRNARINNLLQIASRNLELRFAADNVPIEWDDRLRLSLNSTNMQFSLKPRAEQKQDMLDFHVIVRGLEAESKVDVILDGTIFSRVFTAERHFKNQGWTWLEDDESGILHEHIEQVRGADKLPYCPLCKDKHPFSWPFFCEMAKNDQSLFGQGAMIIDSLRVPNARYVLIKSYGTKLGLIASAQEVVEFDDMAFLYVDIEGDNIFKVLCKQGTTKLEKANKIVDKLYQFGDDEIVCLIKESAG
jgi:hypothetical protein